ncbi:MGMT family protein [Geomonas sp. RF6]|uniref:MGMT family protein n=1 Tax=Geomonas sp. RF6 TaxID=2897342 RepID=UPI001E457E57|nr:MGMT family protein [Geomonas sp. RF6]UFS72346.1 MGMT family protein [Geomonas sp. RF6]
MASQISSASGKYAAIYRVVSLIPPGRVATYGQVAGLAGMPGRARLVGYALRSLPNQSGVPWHRVVNAAGRISLRADGGAEDEFQRVRLEAEGIAFERDGRIPLEVFLWHPDPGSL